MRRETRIYSFLRGVLVVIALVLPALVASAAPRAGHVFIISIDGGKPAVIAESNMPVLKKLAAQGAYTWEARTIYPSITLPAHTSMLTGLVPDKHHVFWNDYEPDKGVVQVPTVFSVAHEAGFSTAMFVGKEKFRHLIIPGTVDEFSFKKTHAEEHTKQMPTGLMSEGTVLAKIVSANAAQYIAAKKPNLCFIHFTDTDDAGHKYGWGSEEQKQAFAAVDAALGVVLDAIKKAGIADDSVMIVTADHGGHAKTHGLLIADDMTIPWVVWGKDVKKNFKITDHVLTYDTAATALWLLGLNCPNCDGKPVTTAFE